MIKQFTIEGYDEIFEIVDQSKTQTTYGAIAYLNGRRCYAFYVTPFADMVEVY